MTMTKTEEIRKLYDEYVMPTYAPGMALVKGEGSRVWDAEGNEYLDFICGIAVTNVGHCHPKVVEAVRQQLATLSHVSNLYYNEPQAKLAEKLAGIGLGGKSFFCNSGAEANEALIKLARLWGNPEGKYEIVTMKSSFHGRTLATAAATGQTKIQVGFEPMPEGFRYAEFNDLDSVEAAITPKTAGVLIEAVQGEGGIIPADPVFIRGVRELCSRNQIMLLCDEVQCGMGRTGKWLGFQNYDISPDSYSMAKGLGSGYPIGALCASPSFSDVFQPGKHASTFGGGPVACASALATMEVIEEEGLLDKAALSGARLKKELECMAAGHDHVLGVRGTGLMLGIVLDRPAKPFTQRMMEQGLITLATAEKVIRLLPPLNVLDREIDKALEIIRNCLEEN